jgi:catechol 2,3-dioxygenase-like lactoylglutathione lyase family enzyme
MGSMKTADIDHEKFMVKDLDESVNFYSGLLRLELKKTSPRTR